MTYDAFLHPYARPTRTDFLCFVRGDGAELEDRDGKRYIDGMAGLWYCNAGHGRSEIADAVAAQMRELAVYQTFDPFTNEPAEHVAEVVRDLAPMDRARVFFTCSGSEAVDSAIKIARIAHVQAGRPERTLVVSRSRAYHGVTYGGLSAQGLPGNQAGFGPLLPDIVNVAADDTEAMAALLSERGEELAAVITEPVQGAGGVYPPPEGYLDALRRLCDQHGAYLIFDEVITGFGRLGTWFAAHHFGVTPDLITFAKAVTSGYQPLGGVIVGPRVREPLEADPTFVLRHGHTYSGHPTACAAAIANLAILERESLPARAPHIGARLSEGLRALERDGVVTNVRGAGAMWAVGLDPRHDATAIRDRMLELGTISRAVGSDTMTFCPPLVISDAQIDRMVDALATSLR